MVGVIFVYVDTVYVFYGYSFLSLVGCVSMIIWTPAVLSVLYAYVLYFCIFTCSAQLIKSQSRMLLTKTWLKSTHPKAMLMMICMKKWQFHVTKEFHVTKMIIGTYVQMFVLSEFTFFFSVLVFTAWVSVSPNG